MHKLHPTLILAVFSFFCSPAVAQTAPRPNIIFILADDLGWGDLSCYGNPTLKTPNLDRLAAGGTLFTHFYVNASVCSPSRCAFFTGQYPARQRIHGHFATPVQNKNRGMPDWLEPSVFNVARLLRSAGYTTAHIGKWHLGYGNSPDAPRPEAYGFDHVGTSERGGAAVQKDDPYFRARSTSLFVDETLQFIRQAKDRPFYVQLWTLVPHATLNPTPQQMQPFLKLSSPSVSYRSPKTIYYATVADLDAQIGRLLDEFQRMGIADNTLIFFSSDNGPEDINILNASHSGIGSAGPFRGRKRSLYEGGVRVPFLVRWAGQVPAKRVDDEAIVAGVDLLPTLAAIAGAKLPEDFRGDGEDASDVLRGKARSRRQPLMWEWRFNIAGEVFHKSPTLAIRDGRWKLHLNPDRSRIELYDVPRDPTQLDNVAARNPDVVERLAERVLAWQKTLPAGPADATAGKAPYAWPGRTPPPKKKQ